MAVVGSGPAGATAARRLAEAGARVLLLERASLPRYKTCGGGIVRRAADRLPDSLLAPALEGSYATAALAERSTDEILQVRRDRPLLHLAMRDRFDGSLVQAAADAGAVVRDGCAVREVEAANGAVRLRTAAGPVLARWLIGADGANGTVARCAGWSAPLRTVPALEWEVRVDDETHRRFSRAPRFDFGVPEHGYAWVFPKTKHLSVGLLSRAPRPRRLADQLHGYLEWLGMGPLVDAQRHGAVIPIRPRPEGSARGRVLLVGDAAGLVDPVTCEGISHALLSGELASRALVEGGFDRPVAVRGAYERSLEREILSDLRLARLLARWVYDRPWARRRAIRWLGPVIVEVMADVISGRRSYRSLLLNPLNYARLLRQAIPR